MLFKPMYVFQISWEFNLNLLRNRNTIFLTFLYYLTVQDSFGIAVIHLRLKMPMKWWNKNQLFLVYLEAFSSSKLIIVLINEKIMSLLRVFSVENKRRKLLWEFLLILKRIVIWENSWDSNLRIRPGFIYNPFLRQN